MSRNQLSRTLLVVSFACCVLACSGDGAGDGPEGGPGVDGGELDAAGPAEDGGIGPETDSGSGPPVPVQSEVETDDSGVVASDVTLEGGSGGALLVPQGIVVSGFDGALVTEAFVLSFDDDAPATSGADFNPLVTLEVAASTGGDPDFLYFGEPLAEDDLSAGLQLELTAPGELLGGMGHREGLYLFRDANDIEESPGDVEDAGWSYVGIVVGDEEGLVTLPLSHVGTYAVSRADGAMGRADEKGRDTPPTDGFETTFVTDGHVRTLSIIEPTTSQVLGATTYEPLEYDPERHEWREGGSPDERLYYRITENPDGTSTVHLRSKFTNQPRIRVFNTEGAGESGLMSPIKRVKDGVVGEEVEPFITDPRAGFIKLRIQGIGGLSAMKDLLAKLREKYSGTNEVMLDYFHKRDLSPPDARFFAHVRISASKQHDHAMVISQFLQDNGYASTVYAGVIAGGDTVTEVNSNLVLINLSP